MCLLTYIANKSFDKGANFSLCSAPALASVELETHSVLSSAVSWQENKQRLSDLLVENEGPVSDLKSELRNSWGKMLTSTQDIWRWLRGWSGVKGTYKYGGRKTVLMQCMQREFYGWPPVSGTGVMLRTCWRAILSSIEIVGGVTVHMKTHRGMRLQALKSHSSHLLTPLLCMRL